MSSSPTKYSLKLTPLKERYCLPQSSDSHKQFHLSFGFYTIRVSVIKAFKVLKNLHSLRKKSIVRKLSSLAYRTDGF